MEAFSVPQSAINPIQVGDPTTGIAPSAIEVHQQPEQGETINITHDADLYQLESEVTEQFVDLIEDRLLKVNSNELWLELELNSNILFPTASADPSLQAKGIFEEIASLFSQYDNPVQVEGFTDNVPINNRRFKSNWELSAARAASVVKLLANNGVNPERLSAVGRGEFQPIADNASADGRAQNRRVVVMISKIATERPQVDNDTAAEIVAQPQVLDNGGDNTSNDPLAQLGDDASIPTVEPTTSADPLIRPVPLTNGGLLFSSDPELQRNNPPITTPAENGNAVESEEVLP